MAELDSSKGNIGTFRKSFLAFLASTLFKTIVWIIAILLIFSFIAPRFIPIEKILPIPEINKIIVEKTGLEVHLNGKARLSILPFFGITAHNVSVANSLYKEKNVISAQKIEVKIAVLPLILKRLVVKNIVIERGSINIEKCNGQYNFYTPHNSQVKDDPKIEEKNDGKNPTFKSISLSNLKIENSDIFYHDCEKNTSYKATQLNAGISIPHYDSSIKAEISMIFNNHKIDFHLKSSSLKELLDENQGNAELTLKSEFGDISTDAKYKINKANPLFFDELKLDISAENISGKNISKQIDSKSILHKIPEIDFELKAHFKNKILQISNINLKSENFSVKSDDITGEITPNIMLSKVKGSLHASIKSVQNLCNTFEIKSDPSIKLPSTASANINFHLENGILKTNENTYIKFDENKVNIASVANLLTNGKFITLNITAGKINIDNYIIPVENAKNKERKKSVKTGITLPKTGEISIESYILIDEILYNKTKFENINASFKLQNNTLSVKTSLNAFSGKILLDGSLTEKSGLTSISTTSNLKNIEISELLKYAKQKPILQGVVTSQVIFSGTGSNADDIMKHNNGSMNLESSNIIVNGFDSDLLVADIRTNYKTIFSGNIKEKYFAENKKSSIGSVSGQFTIKNGVIFNEKTTAKREQIQLIGTGEINAITGQIGYSITPSKDGAILPTLLLNGTLSDINYSIDAKNYIKQNAMSLVTKEFSSPQTQEKVRKFEDMLKSLKKK